LVELQDKNTVLAFFIVVAINQIFPLQIICCKSKVFLGIPIILFRFILNSSPQAVGYTN